nr:uncharacterized protein LOC107415874 [Ziziphus jujuba var. spinosa]
MSCSNIDKAEIEEEEMEEEEYEEELREKVKNSLIAIRAILQVPHELIVNTYRAIDNTHIPAMIRGRDVSNYCNRHRIISQNVLPACNFNLEFMYVLSVWEGSAHDSKVLNNALSKFFLVDCGFLNRCQFLAPFRGIRYHLQEFLGQGRDPKTPNELFNHRHASLINTIERIFGIFKSQFTIFKTAPPFPFDTQAKLVLVCAGLHNFLRKECRSDEFPKKQDNEGSSSSAILANEEDDSEPIIETQEKKREHANQWRYAIVANMWNDVEHFNDNEQ